MQLATRKCALVFMTAFGCSSTTPGGSTSLSGTLAFQPTAVFALSVADGGVGLMGYQNTPGTTLIAVEDAQVGSGGSLSPGQSLQDYACQEFYPVSEQGGGPAINTSPRVLITIVPGSGPLAPGTFPAVGCEDLDAGLACFMSTVAGSADGGTVVITSVPDSDAGLYAGSFTATFGDQVLSGDFSAAFCAETRAGWET